MWTAQPAHSMKRFSSSCNRPDDNGHIAYVCLASWRCACTRMSCYSRELLACVVEWHEGRSRENLTVVAVAFASSYCMVHDYLVASAVFGSNNIGRWMVKHARAVSAGTGTRLSLAHVVSTYKPCKLMPRSQDEPCHVADLGSHLMEVNKQLWW